PSFRIGKNIYDGAADLPLHYMRQQRCGYNPFLKDSCHTHGARIVGSPNGSRDGEYVPIYGGWHDASDCLQYVCTSANAVYQLLFAYQQYPAAFSDQYQADGAAGSNGIPDILDEAKWGIDWLLRMNPDSLTFFNQLADDRDHAGMMLPAQQRVDYGWGAGKERPAYWCSPKPQGLRKYKNRSTGLASTLGKYAAAYSLGAQLLAPYYPELTSLLIQKAGVAYQKGVANPGVCQTACCVSPYFYEEDNWADDLELAAISLHQLQQKKALDKPVSAHSYLKDAVQYARLEPVTPWMGADSARHYQWYPFVNLGHYQVAQQGDSRIRKEQIRHIKAGLQLVLDRAKSSVFLNGVPFVWCSNNLTVGLLTQCSLYRKLTGDNTYLPMETAMRDWLLGCNPWGKCMIVGLPSTGDYPKDPHSAISQFLKVPLTGGLVDGPIYTSIFGQLRGVRLTKEDPYALFQSSTVVYHDDHADYSTNEPTMDGTASLSYYLASLSSAAQPTYSHGGIVRGNQTKQQLSLVFTAHQTIDGLPVIRRALKKHHVSASFFLTGDCYRLHSTLLRQLQQDGNYLAPHSDKHLLYASWSDRSQTLCSKDSFLTDLQDNYQAMQQAGISIEEPRYFLPAYEWHNDSIAAWSKELGVQLINFTSGTRSNADYTWPALSSYCSSSTIYKSIMQKAKAKELNGFILLLHAGTSVERTDKFYTHLDALLTDLKQAGYQIVPLDRLVE
ncbi:MAG: glycoside hydrolase family 9 protein, partial [Bacteroidaceae bacterium]|nr:glycoside hydrolase family 9 protein [Bacteroidaceae bacterium]